MLDSLDKGLDRIWSIDSKAQRHYINALCVDRDGSYLTIIEDMKGFFVPDKGYMVTHFGPSITHPMYDCYDFNGNCKWVGHLVIPIRDVKDRLVGFTGYNPLTRHAEDDKEFLEMARYQESSVHVMDKSKFFLCPLGYKKALYDGYIILLDGYFDTLSVANEGFNSLAILGSSLSKEVKFYLGFIDRVYVAGDNDLAGEKLISRLKLSHPNVFPIVQSKCKDIDDFIKQYPEVFKDKMKAIFNKNATLISLNP